MAIEYLGSGNDDGTSLGREAADLCGMHGTVAIQQTAPTSVLTSSATSASLAYGFESSEQADGLVTAVNSIITALKAKGIYA